MSNEKGNMKIFNISRGMRSVTIYHSDKTGMLVMTSKRTFKKGTAKKEREILIKDFLYQYNLPYKKGS